MAEEPKQGADIWPHKFYGCAGITATLAVLGLLGLLLAMPYKTAELDKTQAESQSFLAAVRQVEYATSSPAYVVNVGMPEYYPNILRVQVSNDFYALSYPQRLHWVQTYYSTWQTTHKPQSAMLSVVDLQGNEVGGAITKRSIWAQKPKIRRPWPPGATVC